MQSLYCETERLVIRPVQMEDYEAFLAGYQQVEPAQNRFDEGQLDLSFVTRDWFQQLLERRRQEAEDDYFYMLHIFRREDGRAVGYCDITPHRREDFQYARIGYTIHNPWWGRGYATEALSAMAQLAFGPLNLHRIEAHVSLDNPASKRVLQKADFSFECIRKAFILEDGVWTDNEIWFLNNEHWEPLEADR